MFEIARLVTISRLRSAETTSSSGVLGVIVKRGEEAFFSVIQVERRTNQVGYGGAEKGWSNDMGITCS